MTVATWPDELPPPEQQGYQKGVVDPRIKRQPDRGPAAYRLRWSAVARPVPMSILISRSAKAVFDDFYEDTTKFGSLLFYMPDPTTDGWAMLDSRGNPMLTMDGRPMLLWKRWLCQFGDSTPSETFVDGRFRISFSVTVMP